MTRLACLVSVLLPALGHAQTYTGELRRGDATLASGEYTDTYEVDVRRGETVSVDVTSSEFDPYVILTGSDGESVQNDDCTPGDLDRACAHLGAEASGIVRVVVTSYAAGETGRYALVIGGTARTGTPPPDSAPPAGSRSSSAAGTQTFRGALERSDDRIDSGEYADAHSFQGTAGESIRVEMESADFDTYLIVRSPTDEQVENDDADGSTDRSVVQLVLPESGRYGITATSYQPGETGRYTVRVSHGAPPAAPAAVDRIVGVFVGVSDYDRPGLPPLRFTARDAETARDAMVAAGMSPRDGILLQDRQATVAGVRRAFERLGRETDDRTQFVFFYSGHGGQYARQSFSRQDPDGLDESIELYDAPLLDDDLDEMLSAVPSGRALVVLDACYSGGFAKDVISRPGRMGLFSSEEDVVSQVASRFEAGGYLSQFFSDAVAQREADADRNGSVTALELSEYVHGRYDADVQGAPHGLVSSGETGLQHQQLVVDRGSVGLTETLFVVGR